jgi:hypothetical protein
MDQETLSQQLASLDNGIKSVKLAIQQKLKEFNTIYPNVGHPTGNVDDMRNVINGLDKEISRQRDLASPGRSNPTNPTGRAYAQSEVERLEAQKGQLESLKRFVITKNGELDSFPSLRSNVVRPWWDKWLLLGGVIGRNCNKVQGLWEQLNISDRETIAQPLRYPEFADAWAEKLRAVALSVEKLTGTLRPAIPQGPFEQLMQRKQLRDIRRNIPIFDEPSPGSESDSDDGDWSD